MKTRTQPSYVIMFLIFVLCLNLTNVSIVFADDGFPPTESPVATEETPEATPLLEEAVPTQETLPVEETLPTEESLEEETAVAELLLNEIPENVDLVVLDQEGEVISLATQEALDVVLDTDPMWCPAGVLPGGAGCTINFATIPLLLTDMRNNTLTYDQDGIIYFTANPGASFALTTAAVSLGSGDFNTLNDFNLTLQGGWNGLNGASATFVTQTNFGTNTLTVGTSANPWVGNITLNNFTFNGVTSSNAVTIYTTSGDITLNNVDVANQRGNFNTALLDSTSGDIVVQNGSSFDGNGGSGNSNQSRGFSADTNTGSITITDTTFTDARGCLNLIITCVDALTNYNGATLSAPSVTLTNVTANNNDLSGIRIDNANSITLNNVTATNNGTLIVGSGVYVNGTGTTIVNVTGGTFSNNEPYGIYVENISSLNYLSPPTCSGNLLPLSIFDPNNCDNVPDTPPTLNLPANVIVEATSASGAVVNFSATATDTEDGAISATCSPISGSTFAITTTTVNCSASDSGGNTSAGSFTVTVQDTTPPTISSHADIFTSTPNGLGAVISYTAPTTFDIVDGPGVTTCTPPSGSTFPQGGTIVVCTATDTHGNTATLNFLVGITARTQSTTTSNGFIIPLTGASSINLDCTNPDSFIINVSGGRIVFNNLCDYGTNINKVIESELPKDLTNGIEFIDGYSLNLNKDGESINSLPKDASVFIEFNLPSDKDTEFGAFYWDGNNWQEIAGEINGNYFTVEITEEIMNSDTFIFVEK